MMKQPHVHAGWMVGLALVLAALVVAPSFAQDAKATGPYHVELSAPDLTFQYREVELKATVTDRQGQPVDGVPVVFSVESDWQANAGVVPRRILTQDGVANTYFRSDMPGRVMVTAQAGGAYDSAEITITGSGSRMSSPKNDADLRRIGPWTD